MKRLLVLGGPEFQIPLVKKAKEMGYYVGLVDFDTDCPALEYADSFYQVSLKNEEEVLKCAKEFKPDGITVGVVDTAVPVASYVISRLGLPGYDEKIAKRATDKYEMIKAFEENNVPHPEFIYIPKEKSDTVPDVSFPVIAKPVDRAGSRGVFLAKNVEELKKSIMSNSEISYSGGVIIEEYMEGPEVSVEMVVTNGIPHVMQITDKTTTEPPYFAEIAHLQPSQLPDDTLNKIKKVAIGAAKALGIKNSLGHAEIKITDKGPKMVEIGARQGSDGITCQLIELSTGISVPELAIQLAMGETPKIPEHKIDKVSYIRFIVTHNGILKSVEGVEEAAKVKNITEVKFFGKIGQKYYEPIDNSGRLGYVIACADSATKAKKSCDEATELIKVRYEE